MGGIIYFSLPESCETMDIVSQIYNTCTLLALQFRKTRPLKEMLSSITELDHFLTVIVKKSLCMMRVHINIVAHFKTSSLTWFIKGFMKDVYKQKQSSYKLDYLSRKIINLKVGNFRWGGGGGL